jgi:hypothetical protein
MPVGYICQGNSSSLCSLRLARLNRARRSRGAEFKIPDSRRNLRKIQRLMNQHAAEKPSWLVIPRRRRRRGISQCLENKPERDSSLLRKSVCRRHLGVRRLDAASEFSRGAELHDAPLAPFKALLTRNSVRAMQRRRRAAALQGASRIFTVCGRLSADGHELLPWK